ncbi:type II secretion system F family protein [Actinophytocola oryzae]|uniref:Type II secretion system (T2SS) protein F n=1 Tax=Actinophytocola oryzae TaxID=502181 RepID=A0A4R7UZX8_9PSEU|nr:type II secretion system F family protein [Actinophytocola oryzae]TDV40666.1 type II secretion system (T2SS) protein F [Actinophytocola oryzae]
MTNSIALLLLAAAVLLASRAKVPSMRLAWLNDRPMPGTGLWTRLNTRRPPNDRRPTRALPAILGVMTAVVTGSTSGLLIGALVAATVWWFLRRARQPPKTDPMTVAATWDLLSACLRAGLPVPTAITAVADELPPAATQALKASADLLALGADAETAWAPATNCPDTAALARGARRAAQSGTALADLVSDLATTVRANAADTAEATAQRAGVLITAPLGLCFLPAFVCLGIVPVIAGLARQLSL